MNRSKNEILETWYETCNEWFEDCPKEKMLNLFAVVLDFLIKIEVLKPNQKL